MSKPLVKYLLLILTLSQRTFKKWLILQIVSGGQKKKPNICIRVYAENKLLKKRTDI